MTQLTVLILLHSTLNAKKNVTHISTKKNEMKNEILTISQ